MTNALSPVIKPTKYERPDKHKENIIEAVEYGDWSINFDMTDESKRLSVTNDGMLMYYQTDGAVYITEEGCHVGEVTYRNHPVVFLREKCLSVLVTLEDEGVIEDLKILNKRDIRGVTVR